MANSGTLQQQPSLKAGDWVSGQGRGGTLAHHSSRKSSHSLIFQQTGRLWETRHVSLTVRIDNVPISTGPGPDAHILNPQVLGSEVVTY